jgi:hypothetical protein
MERSYLLERISPAGTRKHLPFVRVRHPEGVPLTLHAGRPKDLLHVTPFLFSHHTRLLALQQVSFVSQILRFAL